MSSLRTLTRGLGFALALVPMHAGPAAAVVTLPGGDTLLDGSFDQVHYGATGLAYVSPLLYVGDLASTTDPHSHALVTNLAYGYATNGLGTPRLAITYSITNEDPAAFTDLRFILDVQADGSESFVDSVEVVWGAAGAGDPDHFQVVDFSVPGGDLKQAAIATDALDDTNACAAPCDVDFGLQWSLASLAAGESWIITVGLADDGSALSGRMLRARSADTLDTELTLSGVAQVVPEPGSAALLLVGLGILRAAAATRARSRAQISG